MVGKSGNKIQEWQCWFGKQYYEMSEEVDELRQRRDYLEKRERQLMEGVLQVTTLHKKLLTADAYECLQSAVGFPRK